MELILYLFLLDAIDQNALKTEVDMMRVFFCESQQHFWGQIDVHQRLVKIENSAGIHYAIKLCLQLTDRCIFFVEFMIEYACQNAFCLATAEEPIWVYKKVSNASRDKSLLDGVLFGELHPTNRLEPKKK